MADQQLLDYIKQQRQEGKTKEEIKQELLRVGWQVGDIEEALNVVGFTQSSGPSVPPLSAQEQTLTLSALPGVGDLLRRAFSVYKARLGTFAGIMILPSIIVIVGLLVLIPLVVISGPVGILLLIIWVLAMAVISFWAQIALIFAVKDREEKIGVIESFKRSWHKIIPFAWVSILVGFITLGGSMLFIIPGIIFSIWFAFSVYVLVSEDLRGMNALFRSKQLTAGYWWKILWRFFVVIIITSVPVILVYVVLAVGISAAFADLVVRIISALLITPFGSIFGFLLYEDLKRQKTKEKFEPPKKGTKIKFILIGIIGTLLIPAIFASIVLFSLSGARERAQEARIMANMSQLRPAIEIYSMDSYSYSGADCSLVELFPICSSIKEYTGETPTIEASAENYCFYVRLPGGLLGGEYYCFTDVSSGRKTIIFPGGLGYCDGITFICP